MSRPLIILAAGAALVAPIVLGVYALGSARMNAADMEAATMDAPGLGTPGLDAEVVALALDAQMPVDVAPDDVAPLDLTPPASQSAPIALLAEDGGLERMALNDRAGAVALVRQALLDDPVILEEAIAQLEASRAQGEDVQVSQIIADNADSLFSAELASVMGNPDGAITIVEFLDYNCHFCKRAHNDVMALIEANDDVRVIIKDFPVLGPGSLEAAQIAIAFRALGGDMTAFIDAMMREEDAPADTALATQIALDLGADQVALDAAMEDPNLLEPIGAAYTLAEALGIRGTPAFIIGQERLMGAVGFDRMALALQVERDRLAQ